MDVSRDCCCTLRSKDNMAHRYVHYTAQDTKVRTNFTFRITTTYFTVLLFLSALPTSTTFQGMCLKH